MKPPVYDPTWTDEVKILYEHDVRETWDSRVMPHVWLQYQNQLDIYKDIANSFGKKLRILDIGCAQATLAIILAEQGHQVTAVDIRPKFIEYAKSRYTHGDIQFVVGNIFTTQDIDQEFDLIFVNQLIEHVFEPIQMLEKVAEYLGKSGHLVLTTPNGNYFKSSLPSFKEFQLSTKTQAEEFTADGDGHIFAYSQGELEQIVRSSGMVIIDSFCWETPFVSGHIGFRCIFPTVPHSLLKFLDRILVGIPLFARSVGHQLCLITKIEK